ncbi:hypothetical protein GWN26_15760, partial [Candidatus Saccharibacteria bacterium]|nr:hypothetical protein [Candidatus Saccharibacteria bacterium]NIV72424.1 hypothetical protein [Calditrichia bacterium]NIW00494.1 hypothetical protein [Candidatus Saccharibacteria bacterium]NIW80460.1 hypothetical protein [Calditrichia bacterium]
MRFLKLCFLTVVIFLFAFQSLTAQNQKQKLEPEDYDQWQMVSSTDLSANGSWFSYNISLVDGDGWLIIKEVGADSTEEHKFMHGERATFSQ